MPLKVKLLPTVCPFVGAQMCRLSLFAGGGVQFGVAFVFSNTSVSPLSMPEPEPSRHQGGSPHSGSVKLAP